MPSHYFYSANIIFLFVDSIFITMYGNVSDCIFEYSLGPLNLVYTYIEFVVSYSSFKIIE